MTTEQTAINYEILDSAPRLLMEAKLKPLQGDQSKTDWRKRLFHAGSSSLEKYPIWPQVSTVKSASAIQAGSLSAPY